MEQRSIKKFQTLVLNFYRYHGRRDLPWRRTRDPYAILVSEIMMQQTQVARGIERFPRFMKRFPTVEILARSSQSSVLKEWLGLGYNRRALNIHRAAKMVVADYGGKVPSDLEALMKLPGVGPYTANAVLAFAFNKPVVVLDTNIRRVFLYHFFSSSLSLPLKIRGTKGVMSHEESITPPTPVERSGERSTTLRGGVKISDSELIPLIQKTIYRTNPRLWYSALMDYGALGEFGKNPNRSSKHYTKQTKFEGSRRFVRAKLVSCLLNHSRGVALGDLEEYIRSVPHGGNHDVGSVLSELEREGFAVLSNGLWKAKK